MRTDRLKTEMGVSFTWTAFPLHPETPEEGTDLAEYFASRDIDFAAVQERLLKAASREGLTIAPRTRIYNSRLAQELGKYAQDAGLAEAYQISVYRGYFVEGVNIGREDELVPLAVRAGLPERECREALATGRFRPAVDGDWRRSRQLGLSGVPAYLYQGQLLVGFRPYHDFLELLHL